MSKFAGEMEFKSKDIDTNLVDFEKFLQMKAALPDNDNDTIARFLIARKGNVEAAIEQLSNCNKWRAENWPVLKSSCTKELSVGKFYINGCDKDGRPLLVWRTKLHIAKDRDLEEAGRLVIWWVEQAISKLPADRSKFTILIDRSDANNDNVDMDLVKHLAGTFQNYYPERLHKAVVHPTGILFFSIWNVAKWFIDPVTRGKVFPMLKQIGVKEHIEDQYIPKWMGGTSEFVYDINNFEDPYSAEEVMRAQMRDTGIKDHRPSLGSTSIVYNEEGEPTPADEAAAAALLEAANEEN